MGVWDGTEATFRRNPGFFSVFNLNTGFYCWGFPVFGNFLIFGLALFSSDGLDVEDAPAHITPSIRWAK